MKPTLRRVATSLLLMAAAACTTTDEVVKVPQVIGRIQPSYPPASQAADQQGVVQLRARVLASGRVGEVRLLRSSGYSLLDVSAMQALQGASFNPARTRSGKAVDAWVQLPFRFVLE